MNISLNEDQIYMVSGILANHLEYVRSLMIDQIKFKDMASLDRLLGEYKDVEEVYQELVSKIPPHMQDIPRLHDGFGNT